MAIGGLKFFKRNLFACLQEVTSSLRLFKVASSGLQMMKYFSHRHKLQRFETGLKGVVCFKILKFNTTATEARTSSENVTFCFCNRELEQPRPRRQQKPHKFAYLTMENTCIFHLLTFWRRSRSFYDVKWPVLQLCGPREHMMTNVQFCLLMPQALVPISFQDS